MRAIVLSNGMMAIVDADQFERMNKHQWHPLKGHQTHYAARDGGTILMHRELRTAGSSEVDHINGNGLDNRLDNLRVVTKSQQRCNQGKRREKHGSSSQFKGVCWDKARERWAAACKFEGKNVYRGRFDNEIAAAIAYDHAARKHHGEYARLNFPYGAG